MPRHLVGRAVTKGAECISGVSDAPSAEAIRDHLAKMSPEARADFLIKISHQNPQQLALARWDWLAHQTDPIWRPLSTHVGYSEAHLHYPITDIGPPPFNGGFG